MNLRYQLQKLVDDCGVCGLKTGTENEDMNFSEIETLHEITLGIVPLIVKIGGVEARNDIRACIDLDIEGICSPMIESEYALQNFVETLQELIPDDKYHSIYKSINIETITGYRNIEFILNSVYMNDIHSVTAARSDFSKSIGMRPDSFMCMGLIDDIVSRVKTHNKVSSIGGHITVKNFNHIAQNSSPDRINTRHIIVNLSKITREQYIETAEKILNFEIELYQYLSQLFPRKKQHYEKRIIINNTRLCS